MALEFDVAAPRNPGEFHVADISIRYDVNDDEHTYEVTQSLVVPAGRAEPTIDETVRDRIDMLSKRLGRRLPADLDQYPADAEGISWPTSDQVQ